MGIKVALFQFATNAPGKAAALFENMLTVFLANALEKGAGMQVLDFTTPMRGGEMLSLARAFTEEEIREASRRAGADISVWGSLAFAPHGVSLAEGVEISMKTLCDKGARAAHGRAFSLPLRADADRGTLELDMGALAGLAREMMTAVAEAAGIERGRLRPERAVEGLSLSQRALGCFVYALRMAKDPEVKLSLFLRAASADPAFTLAYINAAQLHLAEGRYGEAMRLLLRADSSLGEGRHDPYVLNLLGVTTMHLGMWDDAVRVWRRALGIDPEHVETMCNLAAAYAMREMAEEAEGLYARVLSLREDYPLAWFSLGRLRVRRGAYEEAEGSLRRYMQLCPGDPWGYYLLGMSLLGQGKGDEAEFSLGKAAQLDLHGEAGTLARRELEELKG